VTTDSVSDTRHSTMLAKARAAAPGSQRWTVSRALFVAGSVAIPVGLLLLILGWLGVARTVIVFNQLSYIASGCFIGLALVVLGGFMYFAYWQSIAIDEGREREARLIAHQHDLLDRLDQLTIAVLGDSAQGAGAVAGAGGLVATENGTMVHRATCAIVRDNAGAHAVSADQAASMKPCRICKPLD
jgi:hypothetical protein